MSADDHEPIFPKEYYKTGAGRTHPGYIPMGGYYFYNRSDDRFLILKILWQSQKHKKQKSIQRFLML